MERRLRTAPRLAGLLACAVVPAMLLTGCSGSSGSGSGSGDSTGAAGQSGTSGSASPTTAPDQFGTLPGACSTVTKSTITAVVPKAKAPSGTVAESSDISTRGGCSWTGNGKDGYQYRWLSVTLQRFTSSTALGSGEDQAAKQYTDQVGTLGAASGFTTSAVAGIGDQASSVSGKATVSKVTSQNDTVVVRTGNIVLIIELDGAGLEGKKNPTATTVNNNTQRAAEDVVSAITAANESASPSSSPGSSGTTSTAAPSSTSSLGG
ncbi:MAG: hypothetical protein QOF98_2400 [Streptomyces sp.]|jgi:hypothetical protein|nr:hypothetical protein [Streptomyces sp.]